MVEKSREAETVETDREAGAAMLERVMAAIEGIAGQVAEVSSKTNEVAQKTDALAEANKTVTGELNAMKARMGKLNKKINTPTGIARTANPGDVLGQYRRERQQDVAGLRVGDGPVSRSRQITQNAIPNGPQKFRGQEGEVAGDVVVYVGEKKVMHGAIGYILQHLFVTKNGDRKYKVQFDGLGQDACRETELMHADEYFEMKEREAVATT